jgi:hypothetical protein
VYCFQVSSYLSYPGFELDEELLMRKARRIIPAGMKEYRGGTTNKVEHRKRRDALSAQNGSRLGVNEQREASRYSGPIHIVFTSY